MKETEKAQKRPPKCLHLFLAARRAFNVENHWSSSLQKSNFFSAVLECLEFYKIDPWQKNAFALKRPIFGPGMPLSEHSRTISTS
jgi:hypothetical protein